MKAAVLTAALLAWVASVGAGSAADLPSRKSAMPPPAPLQSPLSWTGFYAGLHAGYVTGDPSVTDLNGGVDPGPFKYRSQGGFGGGQIGYNYQMGAFVGGIEGDIGYFGLSGKGRIGSANAAAHQDLTLDSGVYADVTGRLGVAFGSALLYAKGGYAWFDGQSSQTTTNPGYVTSPASGFNGFTVGGGVEYRLAANISIKAEYQYFDFGHRGGNQTSVGDPPIGYVYYNQTELSLHTAKVGLNYHF